jgi:hypothetical protein
VTGFWVVVSRGLIDAPRSRLAAFLRRRSGLTVRTSVATGADPRSSTPATAPTTQFGTGPSSRGAGQN